MNVTDMMGVGGQEQNINIDENTDDRDFDRGDLGQDDFTKILVTQLKHQDPLEPMDDREFITQMTQFSQLEQLTNLSGSYDKSSALNMLNQEVVAQDEDGEEVRGVVQGVVDLQTNPKLNIDGKYVEVDEVMEVITPENETSVEDED